MVPQIAHEFRDQIPVVCPGWWLTDDESALQLEAVRTFIRQIRELIRGQQSGIRGCSLAGSLFATCRI